MMNDKEDLKETKKEEEEKGIPEDLEQVVKLTYEKLVVPLYK